MRKTRRARCYCWTIYFDRVSNHPAILAPVFDLPLDAQRDAQRAYRLFRTNPSHPGLQFKKLEGEEAIYSARIGLDYRALAVMRKDRVVRYWIGRHAQYNRLV